MTSVVGILNKRGVAIAADSAVTRSRTKTEGRREYKVTKNGNKMIRLCEGVPVAVMFTGNAEFLGTTWDVIARRYRQRRGQHKLATVEEAVHDFFAFVREEKVFWTKRYCNQFLSYLADGCFSSIVEGLKEENERKHDGTMRRPAAFVRAFNRRAARLQKQYLELGICPQFEDYAFDQFLAAADHFLEEFFDRRDCDDGIGFFVRSRELFPREVLDRIRPAFESALWTSLCTRCEGDGSATLVFAGFGAAQDYPSLVSVEVCEGYDGRVNYHIRKEDVINISDEQPVAICPFAQKDVIKSILRGVHGKWSERAIDSLQALTDPYRGDVFDPFGEEESPDPEFRAMLSEVETADLYKKFTRDGLRLLDKNQRTWEQALENYDLQSMASLADSLIDLTAFHRILTFSQEGVGGLVDVAVISKTEGFTWLRRKSWYHKDPGGRDGLLGI